MKATMKDAWGKLRIKKNHSLLDVGGGVGLFADAYHSTARRIVTTDISFTMARDGRNLNPENSFIVCEAKALPFEVSAFDRLLCYSVFHYMRDLAYVEEVLLEFARVVKNRGLILIGDLPLNTTTTPGASKNGALTGRTKRTAHYPSILKHDLKYLSFTNGFFEDFCAKKRLKCRILRQKINGKPAAISRFDVLIEVKK